MDPEKVNWSVRCMHELMFRKRGLLEWEERPEPVIQGPGQALVRPLAVARCDLDLPIVQGQTLFRPPFPIGHEFVGKILGTSADLAEEFQVGDLVAVAFQVACGSCALCNVGHSRNCTTLPGLHDLGMGPGAKTFGGALSDVVHVPFARQMLLKLPPAMDPVPLASLSDNIVEAWKLAGFHLRLRPTDPVLVVGGYAQSIGLYTVALARGMGSAVVYLDYDRERLALAQKLGAVVHELPADSAKWPRLWEERFPLVVDASGLPDGFRFCLRSAAPGGLVTSASIFWTNDLSIPYIDLYNTGITLKIERVDSREMMPEVLTYIKEGVFDVAQVVTQVADWQDAKEAWLEPGIKLVVKR